MPFYKSVPVDITGPTYLSRSKPLSVQQTKNFYHQITKEGKDQYVLHSFAGLTKKGTVTNGADRGGRQALGLGFRVVGNTLYSFSKSGAHTSIGTIEGSSRCIFSDDGANLVIVVPGVKVYVWDGTTLSEVTDTNIINSLAVTFINNQMVYTKSNLFIVANVGDPTTANGLNAANAESQPDDLVRAYAFQQTVYMFGERSTEPWWNTGQGNPPFSRIDGQIFEVGCIAPNSIANTDEAVYWVGDDQAIYQASGGIKKRISSIALSHQMSTYSTLSDAFGYTFTMEGQNFYLVTFPTANKTWCLNESLGESGWFEVSSGTKGGKYQGSTLINVYNDNYVLDETNGNLYILDLDNMQNNGEILHRRRVTSSISGKSIGKNGAEVQMSSFLLIMEVGEGALSGQGVDPQIQFEASYDGGRSWKPKGWGRIGRRGANTVQVRMDNLDVFYDCIIRLTTSDPVPYHIFAATVDLRLTGRR